MDIRFYLFLIWIILHPKPRCIAPRRLYRGFSKVVLSSGKPLPRRQNRLFLLGRESYPGDRYRREEKRNHSLGARPSSGSQSRRVMLIAQLFTASMEFV